MNSFRWLPALLLLVAIAAGVGLLLQRQQSRMLREQIALLQVQQKEVVRLRADNERLKAAQISPAELASLRADHVAVQRLRAELNMLHESIRTAETAVTP